MSKPRTLATCHPDRPSHSSGMCRKCWDVHYYALPHVREKWARWSREWNHNHIASRLLTAAKKRAQKQGVPCTITKEDIVIPRICPVLGITLSPGENRRDRNNSPSLDKLQPELGYVPGNINVISWRANKLKSDGTVEELEALLSWMKEKQYGTSRG